jgi:hypothetical protein
MKSKNKAFQLIEKGLSAETVSKLSESEISILHKRLVVEKKETKEEIKKTVTNVTYDPANPTDQQKLAQMGVHVDPSSKKITMSQSGGAITTEEMTEDDEIEKDPFQLQSTQDKRQVGPGEYGNNPQVDKEMDNDDADGMGIMEDKKSEKNPWAICTAQLGKEFGTKERSQWSAKEMNKYERCVKDVKKSLKEGKNPISLFLENEILRIVEKHIPPKITKGDLMKHLKEQGPTTAPTKPGTKEKPGVKEKPGKPTRPMRPGKNPHPGEKEAPRAKKISHDEAKDNVIQTIMKLLKK